MRKKVLLALIFQLLTLVYLFPQELHFQHFSIKDGLPHNSLYSLLTDSRGFIWAGTNGYGVSVTDGINFRTYDSSDGLYGSIVRALHEDRKGTIWIGTEDGLYTYDGFNFEQFDKAPGLEHSNILSLAEDPDGNILVGTWNNGISIISFSSDTTVRTLHKEDGLISNLVLDIEVDRKNRYWLAQAGGITVLSMEDDSPSIINLDEGIHIPGNTVLSISEDFFGNIWCSARDRGIFYFPGDQQPGEHQALVPEYLKFLNNESIWDIYWADEQTCWLATEKTGLIKLVENRVDQIITRRNGLPSNAIYRITSDQDQCLWLSSLGNGLLRYGGDMFKTFQLNPERLGTEVLDMIQGEDNLLLASTDEGLYSIDIESETESKVKKISALGLSEISEIKCLIRDKNDVVWLGNDDGLYRYNRGRAEYSELNQYLSDLHISCLYVDNSNQLWIGTGNGYNLIVNDTVKNKTEESGLINNEVQTIIQDQQSRIWIGTLGGLVLIDSMRYRDFDKEEGLMDTQIHSLLEDAHGRIWIGTNGGGIYLINPDEAYIRIRKVGGNELLTSQTIYSLFWESDSILLVGTEIGFDKALIRNDSFHSVIHYDSGDGFCEWPNNLNAIFQDSIGRIWYGTSHNLVSYKPGLEKTFVDPKVYIMDIRLFFESQDWTEKYNTSRWFGLPENLILPHDENHLTFDFAAIHFDNLEGIYFSYLLEGQSTLWSPKFEERSITFQDLSPGEYVLRLKAFSKFGRESDELSYSFRVKPPFWFTPWFIISSFLSVLLILFAIIRLRERNLRNDKIKLERTVEFRTWEIRQQKEQIEEQRDIVISQQNEITDSINYAKHIQNAILPQVAILEEYVDDSFILLRPQHIVSGDFYWIGYHKPYLIFSAADCTGHGVPGAFMSMLGISFLNKVITEEGLVKPAEILNALRKNIIDVFHDSNEIEEGTKNGIDMSICSYDTVTRKLYYAGAMNSIYQINKNNGQYSIIEHAPNKMPIGRHDFMSPFTETEIDLAAGNTFYLFSDGFRDQFGGASGKKFLKSRFKQMILEYQDLDMTQQKERFEETFLNWMNTPNSKNTTEHQIDDVLLMGVRI